MRLAIDAKTLEMRAIEVTDNSVGDAPMLPKLQAQIADEQEISSVCADGAYDTKACHEAIAQRNAQVVIPPRKNARLWKVKADKLGERVRNEAVRACQRLGSGEYRLVGALNTKPKRRVLVDPIMKNISSIYRSLKPNQNVV